MGERLVPTTLAVFALALTGACSIETRAEELACEQYRTIASTLAETDMPENPDEMEAVLVATAEMVNHAEDSGDPELSGPSATMLTELSAWPLPRYEREFPPASEAMDARCTELGY